MSKFEVIGDHSKTNVAYRVPGKRSFRKVNLSKASQAELAILHNYGYKFVKENKEAKQAK